MQAQNQEIDHQRVQEELKELSALEIGGIMLSMEKGDGKRFGQKIDPADLPAIPKYDSAESLFKDVETRHVKGELYPKMFELTGRGSSEQYVSETLQELEYRLNQGAGKQLSYMWFRDDKGNAEIFLLDERETPDVAASVKSEKDHAAGCVEFGSIADKNLNRQERLPADTPVEEATIIHRRRAYDASLILRNIDPSLSDDDLAAVMAERDRQIGHFVPQGEYTTEVYRQYVLQAKAIGMGLSPFTSKDIVESTQSNLEKQASAVKLGLGRYATDDEIKNARREIDNYVDDARNFADNYPQGTTSSEILKITEQRLRQSELIGANIDPAKTKEEIANIRSVRESRLMELLQAQNGVTDSTELEMIRNEMSAVKLGLPEDTNPIVIQETQERLSRQSIAVLHGLNLNATQQEIDAAEKKSSDYELQDIPPNVCPVNETGQHE